MAALKVATETRETRYWQVAAGIERFALPVPLEGRCQTKTRRQGPTGFNLYLSVVVQPISDWFTTTREASP